jgi:hypothetical protein
MFNREPKAVQILWRMPFLFVGRSETGYIDKQTQQTYYYDRQWTFLQTIATRSSELCLGGVKTLIAAKAWLILVHLQVVFDFGKSNLFTKLFA